MDDKRLSQGKPPNKIPKGKKKHRQWDKSTYQTESNCHNWPWISEMTAAEWRYFINHTQHDLKAATQKFLQETANKAGKEKLQNLLGHKTRNRNTKLVIEVDE